MDKHIYKNGRINRAWYLWISQKKRKITGLDMFCESITISMDWAKGEFAGRHCFFPNMAVCALFTGNCPLQTILGLYIYIYTFSMSDGVTNGKTKKQLQDDSSNPNHPRSLKAWELVMTCEEAPGEPCFFTDRSDHSPGPMMSHVPWFVWLTSEVAF